MLLIFWVLLDYIFLIQSFRIKPTKYHHIIRWFFRLIILRWLLNLRFIAFPIIKKFLNNFTVVWTTTVVICYLLERLIIGIWSLIHWSCLNILKVKIILIMWVNFPRTFLLTNSLNLKLITSPFLNKFPTHFSFLLKSMEDVLFTLFF